MVAAALVRDKESNLKEVGFRKVGKSMEYEFAFPYQNGDLGDSSWQAGRAYQIAILVGPNEEFKGLTEDTWMSDQIYIRLGSSSTDSIYHPPVLAGRKDLKPRDHSHGAEGKKR
jgi:hypothetical protein